MITDQQILILMIKTMNASGKSSHAIENRNRPKRGL